MGEPLAYAMESIVNGQLDAINTTINLKYKLQAKMALCDLQIIKAETTTDFFKETGCAILPPLKRIGEISVKAIGVAGGVGTIFSKMGQNSDWKNIRTPLLIGGAGMATVFGIILLHPSAVS